PEMLSRFLGPFSPSAGKGRSNMGARLKSPRRHRCVTTLPHGGFGSWLCENAAAGSLTDLDCSAAKLGEVCEHIFPISSLTQPDAAPRIVSAPGPDRKAKVRAHHALTAAIIGLTPKIFSTRVKL